MFGFIFNYSSDSKTKYRTIN